MSTNEIKLADLNAETFIRDQVAAIKAAVRDKVVNTAVSSSLASGS